jgi:hypothetical protein
MPFTKYSYLTNAELLRLVGDRYDDPLLVELISRVPIAHIRPHNETLGSEAAVDHLRRMVPQ